MGGNVSLTVCTFCVHTCSKLLSIVFICIQCASTGLFHLRKIPCLNSLVGHFPETMDLAFKLKRKKFLIEVCFDVCIPHLQKYNTFLLSAETSSSS